MSVFGNIMSAIFDHGAKASPAPAAQSARQVERRQAQKPPAPPACPSIGWMLGPC
jgi:hypothetical protein